MTIKSSRISPEEFDSQLADIRQRFFLLKKIPPPLGPLIPPVESFLCYDTLHPLTPLALHVLQTFQLDPKDLRRLSDQFWTLRRSPVRSYAPILDHGFDCNRHHFFYLTPYLGETLKSMAVGQAGLTDIVNFAMETETKINQSHTPQEIERQEWFSQATTVLEGQTHLGVALCNPDASRPQTPFPTATSLAARAWAERKEWIVLNLYGFTLEQNIFLLAQQIRFLLPELRFNLEGQDSHLLLQFCSQELKKRSPQSKGLFIISESFFDDLQSPALLAVLAKHLECFAGEFGFRFWFEFSQTQKPPLPYRLKTFALQTPGSPISTSPWTLVSPADPQVMALPPEESALLKRAQGLFLDPPAPLSPQLFTLGQSIATEASHFLKISKDRSSDKVLDQMRILTLQMSFLPPASPYPHFAQRHAVVAAQRGLLGESFVILQHLLGILEDQPRCQEKEIARAQFDLLCAELHLRKQTPATTDPPANRFQLRQQVFGLEPHGLEARFFERYQGEINKKDPEKLIRFFEELRAKDQPYLFVNLFPECVATFESIPVIQWIGLAQSFSHFLAKMLQGLTPEAQEDFVSHPPILKTLHFLAAAAKKTRPQDFNLEGHYHRLEKITAPQEVLAEVAHLRESSCDAPPAAFDPFAHFVQKAGHQIRLQAMVLQSELVKQDTERLQARFRHKRHSRIRKVHEILAQKEQIPAANPIDPLLEKNILGRTLAIRKIFHLIQQISKSLSPVLIHGESGTGKELVAQAVQAQSSVAQGPFVTVNCAAIAPELIESEFFGHVRGAFTGADTDRIGLFERANRGTLFLDEIGDMPLYMQVKLLRVLQEEEIKRVGDSQSIPIKVRLICASHRNLKEMIQNHNFREDLFYRLNVIPIDLPPLRNRKEDILLLATHFLQQFSGPKASPLVLHPHVVKAFELYAWPGNVRELMNLMQKMSTLCEGPQVMLHDLPPIFSELYQDFRKHWEHREPIAKGLTFHERIASFEKAYMANALRRHQENISRAARAAGMHRSTFRRLLERFQIKGKW